MNKMFRFLMLPLLTLALLLTACPAPGGEADDDETIEQAAPSEEGEEDGEE